MDLTIDIGYETRKKDHEIENRKDEYWRIWER